MTADQEQDQNGAGTAAAQGKVLHILSRTEILNANDLGHSDIAVPEWTPPGQPTAYVRVKMLTAKERDEWEASLVQGKGRKQSVNTENIRAKLIAATAIDAEGRLIFSLDDVLALGAKSAAAADRVYSGAAALNKISKEDVEDEAGK